MRQRKQIGNNKMVNRNLDIPIIILSVNGLKTKKINELLSETDNSYKLN